eukprot:2932050-Prymnesium_polylepis.1
MAAAATACDGRVVCAPVGFGAPPSMAPRPLRGEDGGGVGVYTHGPQGIVSMARVRARGWTQVLELADMATCQCAHHRACVRAAMHSSGVCDACRAEPCGGAHARARGAWARGT